ncbi:MAG TPA: hypothetical protein VG939_21955 [Caulobacteraceae bacterium]|nr:hypothetical protein [Caulobacteraceae bacterium]
MIRILGLAAAVAALSTLAQAQGITVHVAGKDAAAVHHDIRVAAYRVCHEELGDSMLAEYAMGSCVEHSVARAEAQLKTEVASTAGDHARDVAASTH